ncbi:MAG TPA: alpha/beta hydrolase [Conexibacter sp.]|nr:alpha/beta hydrolase [Conexibacter sp.]
MGAVAIERNHAPASRQTRVLEATLRRSWLPVARAWRMTPRGVRLLQQVTEPGRRVPMLGGTLVGRTHVAGCRAEWVRGPRAQRPQSAAPTDAAAILYLHGGGYVFGSPRTHRNLVSRISHVTGLPALSLDYRLPPVATLPAPIEDALGAYRHLLDAGHAASRIVVAGDSAGGNLALALALHAAEQDLPRPAALILLSPWADLTHSGASFTANALLDPFLPPIALRRAARTALGGADAADWRIASPLFAPDELWPQLPPTLIQVGSTEILHDDGVRVADRLTTAGVPAELHVFERQPHVPPLWTGTPAARTALLEIGRFVDTHLPQAAAPPPPSPQDAATAAFS